MPSAKDKQQKRNCKLMKLINTSDSDDDGSEHELSHYKNDRVKLMKEVIKILKPKRIKAMAPDCIKNHGIEEINSMLLEELLGISNKRLGYIFSGQNVDGESSSTDSDEEKQPIDVISLDDISESDDDIIFASPVEDETEKKGKEKHKKHREKSKHKQIKKEVKKEKSDKGKSKHGSGSKDKSNPGDLSENERLMSVLELLELQARARAIKSQLALESNNKKKEEGPSRLQKKMKNEDSDSDAVVIESPTRDEIVISSSESENEDESKNKSDCLKEISDGISGEVAASGPAETITSEKNDVGEKSDKSNSEVCGGIEDAKTRDETDVTIGQNNANTSSVTFQAQNDENNTTRNTEVVEPEGVLSEVIEPQSSIREGSTTAEITNASSKDLEQNYTATTQKEENKQVKFKKRRIKLLRELEKTTSKEVLKTGTREGSVSNSETRKVEMTLNKKRLQEKNDTECDTIVIDLNDSEVEGIDTD